MRTFDPDEELTCRFCRETVTRTALGKLEDSDGRLACPADPHGYHEADDDD